MLFYKDRILSPEQLKRLEDHKYSTTNCSLLDPVLQPWWNWLVSRLPLWLAPNLITVVGLLVNVLTTLILVWYSPDAKLEPPRWACFLCALGLFIYQSLDAIDGKQARRTDSSSPLGELFDHGCDSISTVFVALSACVAVQLGYYPSWMFFQCFCAMTLFYCAHWQAYVSGTLKFGKIDVTEAQFTIMFIHLVSATCGPTIWMTEIPLLEGRLSHIMSAIFYMGFARAFFAFLLIFEEGGVGKNGSTVAGTSVLSPVIPFSLVILSAFIIYRKSIEHVYENHPTLYIVAFGLVAAKVTNKLVVAHMTKNEMEYLDSSLVGPALLFLNQYFNFFIREHIVLWICLAWVTLDLLRYCTLVCLEICNYMNIQLFRISSKSSGSSVAAPTSVTSEKNVLHADDLEDGNPSTSSTKDAINEDTQPLLSCED